MSVELAVTIVTPEESPLAIFGIGASGAVAELLAEAGIEMVTSAYAEVPRAGEVVVNPGDRRLEVDRMVALPELFGPAVRGLHTSEPRLHPRRRPRPGERRGTACTPPGTPTDFAVKQGGISAQQADAAAESIAALAGAPVEPKPFHPRSTECSSPAPSRAI